MLIIVIINAQDSAQMELSPQTTPKNVSKYAQISPSILSLIIQQECASLFAFLEVMECQAMQLVSSFVGGLIMLTL